MTTKIFKSTFLTGMAALLACVALFFGVLYQYFEARLFTELKSEAAYAAQGLETGGEAYFNGLKIGERITWVAADGTVLYDNEADAATMENHADRQEIKAALENGSGQSAREQGQHAPVQPCHRSRGCAQGHVLRGELGRLFRCGCFGAHGQSLRATPETPSVRSMRTTSGWLSLPPPRRNSAAPNSRSTMKYGAR